MKHRAAAASSGPASTHFQKGQVWKIGEVNLAVTSVGKTLVHYKRYTTQPRGVRTTLSLKSDLAKCLVNSRPSP